MPANNAHSPKQILVAEDDPLLRHLVCEVFRRRGFSVVETESGEEALDAVEKEMPDLLILDLNLPGISGLEVSQTIHERHPSDSSPVILLSGAITEPKGADPETGVSAYLPKTIRSLELVAKARALLEESAGGPPSP
jgi:DNA-binding response OmpR family regulator